MYITHLVCKGQIGVNPIYYGLTAKFRPWYFDGQKIYVVNYTRQNQRQKKQQNNLGEIVCCGNHVFRVINGQRQWITTPPDDWETIDGRVWTK